MSDSTKKHFGTVSPSLHTIGIKPDGVLPCRKCGSTERYTKTRGKYSWKECSNCKRRHNREWQRKNGKLLRHHRRKWHLKKMYGLTKEQYQSMVQSQAGLCGLCGKLAPRLVVDHDHKTGAVRALLCDLCNLGLGAFADSPESLRLAILYLQRFGK